MIFVPTIKINNTNLSKIDLPQSNYILYWDTDLKGFGVKAIQSGLMFITQRRVNERTVRTVIGKYKEITPYEARIKAAAALADLREGIDLNETKKQAKIDAITLAEAFVDFKSSRTLRPRTIETYDENINRTLKDWLDLPLTSITRDMVKKRHEKLSNINGLRGKGVASANQAMRLLRVIFNYAMLAYDNGKGEPIINSNPVVILSQLKSWNKLEPRDTIIQSHDLKSWYQAVLCLENETLRDYFLFLLFSGLRRTETMLLKWSYVDSKTKTLTVPAEITKTGKKRSVPLTDVLLDILSLREEQIVEDNPYIFPGFDGIKHIVEPRWAIYSVRKQSKVNWSPHDLRRTYATIASRLDVSYYKLKHLLGHSVSGDVTGNHYLPIDIETLRGPAQMIATYLKKHTGMGKKLAQDIACSMVNRNNIN